MVNLVSAIPKIYHILHKDRLPAMTIANSCFRLEHMKMAVRINETIINITVRGGYDYL